MKVRRRGGFLCRWFGICPPPDPTVPPPSEPPPQGDRAADAARATNAERAAVGLELFLLDECLANRAQEHAEEMERVGYLSHNGFSQRAAACEYGKASENVAMGYASGESVVDGWMGSAGHRANILGDYNRQGVGVSGSWWCALYGKRY